LPDCLISLTIVKVFSGFRESACGIVTIAGNWEKANRKFATQSVLNYRDRRIPRLWEEKASFRKSSQELDKNRIHFYFTVVPNVVYPFGDGLVHHILGGRIWKLVQASPDHAFTGRTSVLGGLCCPHRTSGTSLAISGIGNRAAGPGGFHQVVEGGALLQRSVTYLLKKSLHVTTYKNNENNKV
jgi:hypothetical protein